MPEQESNETMYARIRSGGCNAGKILSVHRYYNTASRKSGRKPFEIVLNLNERAVMVGDTVTDWAALRQARLNDLRRGDVYAE